MDTCVNELRREYPSDWTLAGQTRIYIRSGPRVAQTQADHDEALVYVREQETPRLEAQDSKQQSQSRRIPSEHVKDPEVVDAAAKPSAIKLRRRHALYQPCPDQTPSRLSSNSFGILDYYMRDPSPPQRCKLHDALGETESFTPSAEAFDFELSGADDGFPSTQVGQSRCQIFTLSLPQGRSDLTLLPLLDPRNQPAMLVNPSLQASYRPRKDILGSSVSTRRDSASYTRSAQRGRCIVADAASSPTSSLTFSAPSTSTAHLATTADMTGVRRSDDTMISSTAPMQKLPRASLGFLFDRSALSHVGPGCFFDDSSDEEMDEGVPLRRKLLWRRTPSLEQSRLAPLRKRGRAARLGRFLLCTGCCSVA